MLRSTRTLSPSPNYYHLLLLIMIMTLTLTVSSPLQHTYEKVRQTSSLSHHTDREEKIEKVGVCVFLSSYGSDSLNEMKEGRKEEKKIDRLMDILFLQLAVSWLEGGD